VLPAHTPRHQPSSSTSTSTAGCCWRTRRQPPRSSRSSSTTNQRRTFGLFDWPPKLRSFSPIFLNPAQASVSSGSCVCPGSSSSSSSSCQHTSMPATHRRVTRRRTVLAQRPGGVAAAGSSSALSATATATAPTPGHPRHPTQEAAHHPAIVCIRAAQVKALASIILRHAKRQQRHNQAARGCSAHRRHSSRTERHSRTAAGQACQTFSTQLLLLLPS
jgi:hypothetical protein